jgi:pimeloyl-ACP methyl ester carboxylesterase
MLYNPRSVALLPLMIDQAVKGNLSPFATTVMMTIEGLDAALSIGMHNSVMCTEDAPFYSSIERDTLRDTYMGDMQLSALDTICSVWPAGVLDDDLREPLATDIPVLVLSGSADPITPPDYATMAMLDLANARHLVLENQGHGQLPVGCMSNVVARFVDSASIDELGEECTDRAFVMPFFLDFAGPTP